MPSHVISDDVPRVICAISLPICVVLGLALLAQTLYRIQRNSAASDWIRTEGHITAIELKPKQAVVKYKYNVGGRDHLGDRYTFLPGGSISEREEITLKYDVGDNIEVFVNPERPEESVLAVRTPPLPYLKTEIFALSACLFLSVMFALKAKRQ